MMFLADLVSTVRFTAALTGISLLVGRTEEICQLENFRSDGLFSWTVFCSQFREPRSRVLRKLLAAAFSYRGVQFLFYLQLLAIVFLALPVLPVKWLAAPAVVALGIKLALNFRCGYGTDGSDQVETMLLAGLVATAPLLSTRAAPIGIWFIAAQSALAYFTSGMSKVFSPAWRNGEAAFKIFNTYTYGCGPVATFFREISWVAAPMCITMVAWECVFPLVLVSPLRITLSLIGIGVFFHAFNAVVMGLNKFFWAFVATYPAILFVHNQVAVLTRGQ